MPAFFEVLKNIWEKHYSGEVTSTSYIPAFLFVFQVRIEQFRRNSFRQLLIFLFDCIIKM